ncbi:molybdenum cofactor biosynthesis protein MoaE [Arthrobacter sp. 35W]|uniref:molybdenum cofactor biosynthesis protein MoaE n=1 Tax=Arthrobacter sp. 35W TaxID=1132441 RepID=UPI0003F4FDE9|nr:molybdenum cofactor biosynthesis protein MoaE [Arthrobacter sp. 35W]
MNTSPAPSDPAGEAEIILASLSAEPISVAEAMAAVDAPDCGAVVVFSGVVRNHDGGKDVARLGYTAHPTASGVIAAVAAAVLAELVPEGRQARLWVSHRVGPLDVGDSALVCAVATAHRGLALEVCSAVVDRIKAEVPIWKEQFFADGTVEWVGAGSTGTETGPGPQ